MMNFVFLKCLNKKMVWTSFWDPVRNPEKIRIEKNKICQLIKKNISKQQPPAIKQRIHFKFSYTGHLLTKEHKTKENENELTCT